MVSAVITEVDDKMHYQKVIDSAVSISFFLPSPTHRSQLSEGGFPQEVNEGMQLRVSTIAQAEEVGEEEAPFVI